MSITNLTNRGIGIAIFTQPAFQEAVYFTHGMDTPKYCYHPRALPSDVIWLTNIPYAQSAHLPANVKHSNYFRLCMDEITQELGLQSSNAHEKVVTLFMFLNRLDQTGEWESTINHKLAHFSAAEHFKIKSKPHNDWDSIGVQAFARHWGHTKTFTTGLLPGKIILPRFDFTMTCISHGLIDFSRPPEVVIGNFKNEAAIRFAKDRHGFCRISISNPAQEIIDFIDTTRTVVTIDEMLWLANVAEIEVKAFYLGQHTSHPLFIKSQELKAYSWLDSLRIESFYYAPVCLGKTVESYLRGCSHALAAQYALVYSKMIDTSISGITHGTLHFASSAKEAVHLINASNQLGCLVQVEDSNALTSGRWDTPVSQGITYN